MADDDGSRAFIVLFLVAIIVILGFFIFFFIFRRSQPIAGSCNGTDQCDPGLICASGTCRVPLSGECTTITDCESSAQECRSLKAGLPPTCNYATGSLGSACGNQIGNNACASAFVCDFMASSSVSQQPSFTCVIPNCKTGCEGNNALCLNGSTCSSSGQCVPAAGCPMLASPPTPSNLAIPKAVSLYQRLPINDRIIYDNKYLDATNEGLKLNGVLVSNKIYQQLFTFDGYLYALAPIGGTVVRLDYGTFRETTISLPIRDINYVSSTLDDNAVWVQGSNTGSLYTTKNGWKKGVSERIKPGNYRVYGGNASLYHETTETEPKVAVDWEGNLLYSKGNERIRIVGQQVLYY
jgi:hypothetical protein